MEYIKEYNQHNSSSLLDACTNGEIEDVKAFLADPDIDPSDDDNWAIIVSSHCGYIDIVRLLLDDPRVDPSARNNLAINRASDKAHSDNVYNDIIDLLILDDRVLNKLGEGRLDYLPVSIRHSLFRYFDIDTFDELKIAFDLIR